jgi:hypothetical protein
MSAWTALKCSTLNDTTLPFYNSFFIGPSEATVFGVSEDAKAVMLLFTKLDFIRMYLLDALF